MQEGKVVLVKRLLAVGGQGAFRGPVGLGETLEAGLAREISKKPAWRCRSERSSMVRCILLIPSGRSGILRPIDYLVARRRVARSRLRLAAVELVEPMIRALR